MLESGCYLVQLPFFNHWRIPFGDSVCESELDISSEVTLYQGMTTFCIPPLHHLLPGNLRDWIQIWLWTQESCRRMVFPVAQGTDSPQRWSHPGSWPILRVRHVAASLSMASITFLIKSSSPWYLFQCLLNPHYIQRPNHSELKLPIFLKTRSLLNRDVHRNIYEWNISFLLLAVKMF